MYDINTLEQVMTPSELKYNVNEFNPDSHYFNRKSMKFFGDTMANYGVKSTNVKVISTGHGVIVAECWELYRKRPVKNGLQLSVYFDKITFKRVFPLGDE